MFAFFCASVVHPCLTLLGALIGHLVGHKFVALVVDLDADLNIVFGKRSHAHVVVGVSDELDEEFRVFIDSSSVDD